MGQKIVALKAPPRVRDRKGLRSKAPTLQALQTLRERIARHDIAPGTKLREHELAEEFSISRARIRELFGVLESRGLIERIPNRGAIVTRLDLEQVFHLYDVRAALEGLCVRLATQNMPPETWQEFVDLFGEPMDRYVKAGDFDTFLATYERFRRRFIECARNPVAAQMLDSIYEKTHVIIRRIVILPGRAETGLTEHRATVAAMRAGDAAGAEAMKRANLEGAKSYLRRFQKYVL